MMPSGPPVTAFTAAVFVTIVKVISLSAATSRGLSAQRAPASSSGSAFSRVRFQTVTVWPASSRRRTTPPPITPRPTKPSSAIQRTSLDVRPHPNEVRLHLLTRTPDVPGGDCRADRAVLDDRALRTARDQDDREQGTADEVANRLHAVQNEPVAGRLGDREMEAKVSVDEPLRTVRLAQRCIHVGDGNVHLLEMPL